MKTFKTLTLFLVITLFFSCQPALESAPKIDLTTYNLNLATAQKYFASFSTEDLESQKPSYVQELLIMPHFWVVNLQIWRRCLLMARHGWIISTIFRTQIQNGSLEQTTLENPMDQS